MWMPCIVLFWLLSLMAFCTMSEGLDVDCTAGENRLLVEYPIDFYNGLVQCGSLMMKQDVMQPPLVHYMAAQLDHMYTLLYVSVDSQIDVSRSSKAAYGPMHVHWAVANLTAATLTGSGNMREGIAVRKEWPHHGPGPSQRYSFLLMEHDGPTPVMDTATTVGNCFLADMCPVSMWETWITSLPWTKVSENYVTLVWHEDPYRGESHNASHTIPSSTTESELILAIENLTWNTAVCVDKNLFCQINLHIVHGIIPENITDSSVESIVEARYKFKNESISEPFPIPSRSDYTFQDTSKDDNANVLPKGLLALQFSAVFVATVPKTSIASEVCTRIEAVAQTGSVAAGGVAKGRTLESCFPIDVLSYPSKPGFPLEGILVHPACAYVCKGAVCRGFVHMIVTVFGSDPTRPVYGGGEMARRVAGKPLVFSNKGLNQLFQAKPQIGDGRFEGIIGQRVQISWQGYGTRDELSREACLHLWVADGLTGEVADVIYELKEGQLRAPTDRMFCFIPEFMSPSVDI